MNPEDIINDVLDNDEKLIWTGRAQREIMFHRSDVVLIPLSLVLAVFVARWDIMAINLTHAAVESTGPGVMIYPILGAIFTVICAYMIFGRLLLDTNLRENTIYGITSQRAIIISGALHNRVKNLDLSTQTDLSLLLKKDGKGTILFSKSPSYFKELVGGIIPLIAHNRSPKFEMIENAEHVYNIIKQQHQSSKQ